MWEINFFLKSSQVKFSSFTLCASAPLRVSEAGRSLIKKCSLFYEETKLCKWVGSGICLTIALPISKEEVAAGEGALQT